MDKINTPDNNVRDKKHFIILGLIFIFIVVAVFLLVNKKQQSADNNLVNNTAPLNNLNSNEPVTSTVSSEDLKSATSTVAGGNPITQAGEVINPDGLVVQNDALAFSAGAPVQTPTLSKEELPDSVIKLGVSGGVWSPSSFTVEAGSPVTVAISSNEDFTHVFKFNDSSLSAVKVFVSPNQTRAITFNAPSAPGEYIFSCDVPLHATGGEVGKMIVK